MLSRVTDSSQKKAETDFVIRKAPQSPMKIVLMFLVSFGLIFASLLLPQEFGGLGISALVIGGILGGLLIYTLMLAQRSQDMVLATEFQNALFSSAAGVHTRFNLIIKQNGGIAYYSPGFREMLEGTPYFGASSVDRLLESDGVSPESRQKINQAMVAGESASIVCELPTKNGPQQVRLSIYPIPRPKGFFLMSVSDAERRGDNRRGSDRRGSSGDLLADAGKVFGHALDSLPLGLYVASADGTIKYTNAVLEHWLGYEPGEVMSKALSLQQLIHQQGDMEPARLIVDNYNGEVLFSRKQGTLVRGMVKQETIVDDEGKTIGCRALVEDTEKKTLSA